MRQLTGGYTRGPYLGGRCHPGRSDRAVSKGSCRLAGRQGVGPRRKSERCQLEHGLRNFAHGRLLSIREDSKCQQAKRERRGNRFEMSADVPSMLALIDFAGPLGSNCRRFSDSSCRVRALGAR